MITAHTNLEYSDEDYDVLCSTEYGSTTLLNAIVGCFEEDANECNRLLGMMVDDYLENNSASNLIAMAINQLVAKLSTVVSEFKSKVDEMDVKKMLPEDFDIEKLNGLINKYSK
jgi:hypothetical protein